MDQHSKSELIRSYRERYRRASRRGKTNIIDTIVEAAGYCRKHVIRALNKEVDVPKKVTRTRTSRYARVYKALQFVWATSNYVCGKRLKPFLPTLVKALKHHKELRISKEDEALLLTASAATIDRLLTPDRRRMRLKGRCTTRPGSLLKHKIPVHTFADWNDEKPGFVELDLVAHCGDSTRGEYVNTLNMTDIATGWTVCAAFMGRSQRFCVEAIREATPSFPFRLQAIDSDNDSAFINYHLIAYCEQEQLSFTRGRPFKKNDSAHIEQKNWDVVRKIIGYGRFETHEQLDIIKHIHRLLALYQNYFQPSRKLVAKKRIGSRVVKQYDVARTPAQRLAERKDTSRQTKTQLQTVFRELNPAQLRLTIDDLVTQLYDTLRE